MIAAGKAAIEPALEHVIERGDLLGDAHRVMRRHGVAHDTGVHSLAVLAHEQTEHARVVVRLEPFNLQMMLGLAVAVETELVGELHVATHLIEETLV